MKWISNFLLNPTPCFFFFVTKFCFWIIRPFLLKNIVYFQKSCLPHKQHSVVITLYDNSVEMYTDDIINNYYPCYLTRSSANCLCRFYCVLDTNTCRTAGERQLIKPALVCIDRVVVVLRNFTRSLRTYIPHNTRANYSKTRAAQNPPHYASFHCWQGRIVIWSVKIAVRLWDVRPVTSRVVVYSRQHPYQEHYDTFILLLDVTFSVPSCMQPSNKNDSTRCLLPVKFGYIHPQKLSKQSIYRSVVAQLMC